MANGEIAPPGRIRVAGDPTVSEHRPAELSVPATARLVNRPGTESDPPLTRKLAALGETSRVNVPPTLHPSKPKRPPPITVSESEPWSPVPPTASGWGVATDRV